MERVEKSIKTVRLQEFGSTASGLTLLGAALAALVQLLPLERQSLVFRGTL